jgi:hypothetical protein
VNHSSVQLQVGSMAGQYAATGALLRACCQVGVLAGEGLSEEI